MATVHDVAAFILGSIGETTGLKLQKLVYYAQAWSLAWDGTPLFRERIEAWANGPVAPELWKAHRNRYNVSKVPGNPARLTADEQVTIKAVLELYGQRDGEWLGELTHRETPWSAARGNIPTDVQSKAEIGQEAMRTYYASSMKALGLPKKTFPAAYAEGLELIVQLTPDEIAAMNETAPVTFEEAIRRLEADEDI